MSQFRRQNLAGAKLTGEMVLWGREQYADGLMNMRQIAEVQKVSRETVARYIRGETWKELGLPDEHEQVADERLQRMAQQTAPAGDSPVIQASLARLALLMNKQTTEEQTDGLQRQMDDLLAGRDDKSDDLPVADDAEHQRGEAASEDAEINRPARPAAKADG